MNEEKLTKYLIIAGASVLFVIVIVAWSFDTIEPTEWGLKYNSISKKVHREKG